MKLLLSSDKIKGATTTFLLIILNIDSTWVSHSKGERPPAGLMNKISDKHKGHHLCPPQQYF